VAIPTYRPATQPQWPGRVWWLGLLAILALAGVFRFVGYNFSLPFVDHPDEPTFFLTALEGRGEFSLNNYIAGYPPLYIGLHTLAQAIIGTESVAEAVGLFRLISATFSMITLTLIALTAWRIMGVWAGWAAGMAWAVAPLVVEHAIYATPDPLLYLLVVLALWLAVESLFGRPRYALWSIAAGCLAILTKYYVLSAVLPGVCALVLVMAGNRRQGLRLLVPALLMLAVTAAVTVTGIVALPREAATARELGLANALNPGRVLNNVGYSVYPLGSIAVVYAAAGVVAWLAAPRLAAVRARPAAVLLVALAAITIPWLASTFSLVSSVNRMKDVLPATAGFCVLIGVALGQIAALAPPRWRPATSVIISLPLIVLVWLPQTGDSWSMIQNRLLPDHRVALRQWADAALEPGTVLVGPENEKTFNPYWGGIPAAHWFDWWQTNDLLLKSAEAWRQDSGISYAAIEQSTWNSLPGSEAGRAFVAAVLPLRTFSGPGRGPEMTLVRLWRPATETEAVFGELIQLIGYDLSAREAAPGDLITLRFYWNATAPPQANYSLFVHLVSEGDSTPLAQVDGAPASPGRPTLLWTDVSETIISNPFTLTVPPDLAPGVYELRLGLYHPETSARLPVTGSGAMPAGDALRLTTLTISAPAP
jgi:4-amino-4-deoxy-L-arabinose transferase-like glycosyltransferase